MYITVIFNRNKIYSWSWSNIRQYYFYIAKGIFRKCLYISTDLRNASEIFLENRLEHYNENTNDLFLHVFGNSYNVTRIVIKSDRNSSWIEGITPNDGGENKTLCFVKTLSEHIDPILSCTPQIMEENNASRNADDDSDSEITRLMQKNGASTNYENIDDDSDIEITGFIPGTARSANTNSKKAGYIPIKIKNDETNCSRWNQFYLEMKQVS